MAKHDEWCELCNDKAKQVTGMILEREISICKHCASLFPGFKLVDGGKAAKG